MPLKKKDRRRLPKYGDNFEQFAIDVVNLEALSAIKFYDALALTYLVMGRIHQQDSKTELSDDHVRIWKTLRELSTYLGQMWKDTAVFNHPFMVPSDETFNTHDVPIYKMAAFIGEDLAWEETLEVIKLIYNKYKTKSSHRDTKDGGMHYLFVYERVADVHTAVKDAWDTAKKLSIMK